MNCKAHEISKQMANERKRISIETAQYNKALAEQQKIEGHRNKYRYVSFGGFSMTNMHSSTAYKTHETKRPARNKQN